MRQSRPRTVSSPGFTLIEVLITVVLMGIVAAVLATVFTVIVRNTPTQAERADDARSLLGLTTWLPQDVGSAAEAGFAQSPAGSSCSSGVPAGQGLLELEWSSDVFPSGTVYTATYMFVDGEPGFGTIFRYTCVNGGTARSLKMTAPLRKFIGTQSESPTPVNITLEPATSGNPGHRGLEFEVIVLDDDGVTQRELISLDAFTANVFTTLPATTTPTTTVAGPNQPPVAADMTMNVDLDVPFNVSFPATDPDADPLVPTVLSASPELSVTPGPSGLQVSVLADSLLSGAVAGGTYQFTYSVDDTTPATSNVGTVTVLVNAAPGTPSTSTSTTTTTPPPPCAATFDPGNETNPSSIEIKNNNTLQNNLTINIVNTSFCTPLVVTFDPMPNDSNMTPEAIAFGAGTSVTINKNAYTWDDSETSFTFTLRQGANGGAEATHTVGVI